MLNGKRNRRIRVKNDNKNLCESNSEAAATLKSINRGIHGAPRLEIDQPQSLSTIFGIVSSSSDEKQRTEMIQSVQTLDDLSNENGFSFVKKFSLSQRENTLEDKRHAQTMPVKLLRRLQGM
ncbi:unnamed protein product [Lepeophtheirus salmonis]|uniref:(salmon louse) hypothetical protein n=1 Tax=Lepeophtheirus salmonis TaxID=72036 RepID=A0A7R8CG32_LEPSM|nr:unnamed protein product [Lepeophtheirus salmonis]CAF2812154.1 unnamed protein product [Lepeophtheirus salmonis]